MPAMWCLCPQSKCTQNASSINVIYSQYLVRTTIVSMAHCLPFMVFILFEKEIIERIVHICSLNFTHTMGVYRRYSSDDDDDCLSSNSAPHMTNVTY